MKNRNGFLLAEETLKIVIALIAITFLIYFLASLYFAKVNGANFEQAKRILIDSSESLKKTIENLNEGEAREFVFDSPKGWNFITFTENEKPNSCDGEKCACICDSAWIKSQAEKCDEPNKGICVAIQNMQSPDLTIEIQSSLTKIFLAKKSGEIIISKNPIEEKTISENSDEQSSKGESANSEVETANSEENKEGFFTAAGNYLKTIWGKIRGSSLDGTKGSTSATGGAKGRTETVGEEQT